VDPYLGSTRFYTVVILDSEPRLRVRAYSPVVTNCRHHWGMAQRRYV
jgi:hypothetical protein